MNPAGIVIHFHVLKNLSFYFVPDLERDFGSLGKGADF